MTDKKSIICPWIAAFLLFGNLDFLTKILKMNIDMIIG